MFSQKTKQGDLTNFIPLVWNWQLMNNMTTSDELHDYDLNLVSKNIDIPESSYKIIGSKRIKGQTIRPLNIDCKPAKRLLHGTHYWAINYNTASLVRLSVDTAEFVNQDKKVCVKKMLNEGYIFSRARYYPDQKLEPRVWSGKPYYSKQITFSSSLKVKNVLPITFEWLKKDHVRISLCEYVMNIRYGLAASPRQLLIIENIARLDGFDSIDDLLQWFDKDFYGQIIVWDGFDYKNKLKKLFT